MPSYAKKAKPKHKKIKEAVIQKRNSPENVKENKNATLSLHCYVEKL